MSWLTFFIIPKRLRATFNRTYNTHATLPANGNCEFTIHIFAVFFSYLANMPIRLLFYMPCSAIVSSHLVPIISILRLENFTFITCTTWAVLHTQHTHTDSHIHSRSHPSHNNSTAFVHYKWADGIKCYLREYKMKMIIILTCSFLIVIFCKKKQFFF